MPQPQNTPLASSPPSPRQPGGHLDTHGAQGDHQLRPTPVHPTPDFRTHNITASATHRRMEACTHRSNEPPSATSGGVPHRHGRPPDKAPGSTEPLGDEAESPGPEIPSPGVHAPGAPAPRAFTPPELQPPGLPSPRVFSLRTLEGELHALKPASSNSPGRQVFSPRTSTASPPVEGIPHAKVEDPATPSFQALGPSAPSLQAPGLSSPRVSGRALRASFAPPGLRAFRPPSFQAAHFDGEISPRLQEPTCRRLRAGTRPLRASRASELPGMRASRPPSAAGSRVGSIAATSQRGPPAAGPGPADSLRLQRKIKCEGGAPTTDPRGARSRSWPVLRR